MENKKWLAIPLIILILFITTACNGNEKYEKVLTVSYVAQYNNTTQIRDKYDNTFFLERTIDLEVGKTYKVWRGVKDGKYFQGYELVKNSDKVDDVK
ncbi:MAG: hypothetical protein WC389_21010 [Lutibacter sp.]